MTYNPLPKAFHRERVIMALCDLVSSIKAYGYAVTYKRPRCILDISLFQCGMAHTAR